jgi:hypothetical protein
LKKIFSLPSWNRKYLLVIIPVLLVVLAGWGGYWFQRASRRESLAARIPASAIGYVEVTSLAALVGDLSATPAWRELAGADGREVADALSGLRRLALTVSGDELTVLTGSQLALVLTAVEVREQEVRPRLALLVEPGQRSERIGEWLEQRLRALAGRLYGEGRVETRTGFYAGVETVGYHPRDTGTGEESAERGLFTARVGSGWIVANHADPLRQTIDAWLGRTPAIASSFHWRQARRQLAGMEPENEMAAVDGLFGFVSGEGLVRLLRSATHMVASGSAAQALLAGVLGDVVTELSAKAGEGLSFREEYGPNGATTRYVVLLRPDLIDTLQAKIRPVVPRPENRTGLALSGLLPTELTDLTLYRVESPNQALGAIEAAISARIGVGQSFVLHQFLTAARESFPAIRVDSTANAAIGDEIIEAGFAGETGERLWLLETRDRTAMIRLARSFLSSGSNPTPPPSSDWDGAAILDSGDSRRGAAVMVDNYLIIGQPGRLQGLLDRSRSSPPGAGGLPGHSLLQMAPPISGSPLVINYVRTDGEILSGMLPLMRLMTGRAVTEPDPETLERKLVGLPSTLRTVALVPAGVEIESRSPLGNFPQLAGLLGSFPLGGDPGAGN